MKFELRPYQREAVDDLLKALERAKKLYEAEAQETSVSLSATTGAGKTVMAAAAIEALFNGNGEFDVDLDPGAVVIWFSDDPNLNDQTRFRLMEASEKLRSTDLVTIEPPFAVPKLEPGKVYFLNTQKLSKSSLLTRGHDAGDEEGVLPTMTSAAAPDLQGWTIWETIANTIDDDDLTLYLILDEAHRGFNTKATKDKPTIVRNLISGQGKYPPIPIVVGISATIERFKEAMEAADAVGNRRQLPPISVDAARVQESGLVKDAVVLEIPDESGNFDTVLVRRAAEKLKQSTERWQRYLNSQGSGDAVWPLLVLQAPNTPDPDQIGRALDEIFKVLPGLGPDAVRHVLGDHSTQAFGGWDVHWIEPQRVQESSGVRILVAKDAISTGWDCPRAEVMVSFRPATDHTHITQLLGRMVRSPLARRVPGDEKLNSVECILPFFDKTTAGNVVRFLTGQTDGVPDPTRRKTIIKECLLEPNEAIPAEVWEAWDSVPTQTIPQRGAAPVRRLESLALALSKDGVRPGAVAEVKTEFHRVLDELKTQYATQVRKSIVEIWNVKIQRISGSMGSEILVYDDIAEKADDRAIQVGFADAKKAFGSDVAISYVNHLADDDDDDALRDAYVMASALAISPDVRVQVDREADAIATQWFGEHREAIAELNDERQAEYDTIQALATDPQLGQLTRPRTRIEDYIEVDGKGQQSLAPTAERHLMSDQNGQMPVGALNDWERDVVAAELARDDSVGWYRNPSQRTADSVSVAYRDESGNWRSMHPDFIFFNEVDGEVKPSIVDPHGHHLEDSTLKLHGLARFAEEFGERFHRIEAISKVDGSWRVLDLQQADVRKKVLASKAAPAELYKSDAARGYDE